MTPDMEGLVLACDWDGRHYEFIADSGQEWPLLKEARTGEKGPESRLWELRPDTYNQDGLEKYDFLCSQGLLTDLRGLLVLWRFLYQEGKTAEWWSIAKKLREFPEIGRILFNIELRVVRIEEKLRLISRVVNF